MIVECCGAPGAGKTTTARELVAALQAVDLPAFLPLESISTRRPMRARLASKLRLAAIELTRHPVSSASVLRLVLESRQRTTRDLVARSLNLLVLRSAYRGARATAGVHVFDQGIVQELASIGYAARRFPDVAIGDPGHGDLAPDLILAIDVDADTANTRLTGRPGRESRVEAAGLNQLSEIIKQKDLIDVLLVAWLERYADAMPSSVVHIDNRTNAPSLDELVVNIRALHMHEKENA
ncbi:MAG: AAA family ATPase [Acidimicrobiia bacterium]|nr:AAA family ATPase [Acidimicrobiia bacterium]